MSDLPRLSDLNIQDDILRSSYYRIVLDYVSSADSDLAEYDVKIDEEFRPDLISYRHYGSADLGWLIMLICDLDDATEPLPVGETIYLPPSAWVRRTMRQFMDELRL
ncbi:MULTISPECIES: baseplate protein [Vibrio]|uniref:baseplate protein n=1 Tax=Vibrio TaxID=662 RepID=UPI00111F7F7A|nr:MULTISPECIES: baseplate protein [Vibrio]EGQ9764635.1 baseplate protein [Vibrio alginolyticus]EGR1298356.1 baseplate protein [Vibrio alginolyticus]EJL6751450.1 hypothetical protein [Vibrio alginolyticus]EJL6927778.1 hypothetical protein [Vibrio alginolyticus]EKL9831022.1 hypothetical protein [Vibrio alginolyticus]